MTAKTYLLRALVFGVLIACAVVAINVLIDPYAIVGTPRIAGLNEFKVDINEHARLMKKYQPLFETHNALIVGNSRVEMGIRPSHPCFARNGISIYNLGMPGADVRSQLEYALNLVHQQPIRTIFLSVDFTDFISAYADRPTDTTALFASSGGEFRLTPAGVPNRDYSLAAFKDYLKSLFSLDALIASIETLLGQNHFATDRDSTGFNPGRDFERAVSIEGPRALFDQKMHELKNRYSRPLYVRDSGGRLNSAFDDLDDFLQFAGERGIKVYLFTNPFHSVYWEMLRQQGHMAVYEDWMRSIEDLVRKHEKDSVELWDFSVDSPYIHEPVPGSGVKSGPLQWFWEPAHYRQQLGDLMVDAMLSESCGSSVVIGRRVF